MARKRFGRTLISSGAADEYAFTALTQGSDHANLAGDCQSPVMVALTGLRDKSLAWLDMLTYETKWPGTDFAPGVGWLGDQPESHLEHFGKVRNVDIAVRCRKCPACLRARAKLWRLRATKETIAAKRTWFSTLTLDPRWQFYCMTQARAAIAEQGLSWDLLKPDDRFKCLCAPLIHEFQKFMKRLRKKADGIRYVLVVEQHKSGDPHLHCLIHETASPVRWRDVDACWRWGFHKTYLVQEAEAAAWYVAKYLTKSAATRLRASLRYGRDADPPEVPAVHHPLRNRKKSQF